MGMRLLLMGWTMEETIRMVVEGRPAGSLKRGVLVGEFLFQMVVFRGADLIGSRYCSKRRSSPGLDDGRGSKRR
jgi:hypothetical protein